MPLPRIPIPLRRVNSGEDVADDYRRQLAEDERHRDLQLCEVARRRAAAHGETYMSDALVREQRHTTVSHKTSFF